MVGCYNSTLTTVLNRDTPLKTRDVAKKRLVKQDSAVQFPPHDDKYLLANAMKNFFVKKVSDIRLDLDATAQRSSGSSKYDFDRPKEAVVNPLLKKHGLDLLYGNYCPLRDIPDCSFDKNTQLTDLDLSGNQLTDLPDGIFDNNAVLRKLNRAAKSGKEEHVYRATDLPFITYKHVAWSPRNRPKQNSDGNIVPPPPTARWSLMSLGRLKGWDLSGNQLTDLPDGIFDRNAELWDLNRAAKSGKEEHVYRATDLPFITYKHVAWSPRNRPKQNSDGNIVPPPPTARWSLMSLGRLKGWDLSGNQLTDLPDGIFDRNAELWDLDLSGNQLTDLPDGIFDNNAVLRKLNRAAKSGKEEHVYRATDLPFITYKHVAWSPRNRPKQNSDGNIVPPPPTARWSLMSLGRLKGWDFSGNQLTDLPDGIFDRNAELSDLDFSGNQLTDLPDGIFDRNAELSDLDFSGNQLTDLPDGIFDRNAELSDLDFSGNQLTDLPDGIFDRNAELSDLDFSGNQLTDLPDGIFDRNAELSDLDLSGNQLTDLPDGIFDRNAELWDLDLSGNQLTDLPDGIFDNNAVLRKLNRAAKSGKEEHVYRATDLPFITYKHVAWSPRNRPKQNSDGNIVPPPPTARWSLMSLGRLKGWDFLGNQLTDLPDGIFDRNAELWDLDLSGNQLTDLPDGIFDNNAVLRKLDLSGNQLTDLPDGIFDNNAVLRKLNRAAKSGKEEHVYRATDLPFITYKHVAWSPRNRPKQNSDGNIVPPPPTARWSLMSLGRLKGWDLSGNQLTDLPDGIFDRNAELWHLDFLGNQLRDLPDGIFDRNADLWDLHLSGNQLTDLPDGIFDNNAVLEYLFFSRNQLTNLSDGIFDNNAVLRCLDLSGNQLTDLPDGIFDNNAVLEYLFFSGNQLTNLSDGIFDNNAVLRYLAFSGNQLTDLPDGIFDNNAVLEYLDLSGNQLRDLPDGIFDRNAELWDL
ncbi:uncharacterized protein [Montipora foliosa]|uniref:uncharacterized protein n=1 Tax=Montipora foliosa TaxID=591990 RepID=UPI0035F130C0